MIVCRRKPNRLKGFNYSSNGYYYVTICVNKRKCIFGEIVNKKMNLNKYGNFVKQQWLWLENQYKYIKLDEFQIMPNHIHGIIIIIPTVGTGLDLSLQEKYLSLSNIVGAYKTTSSKLIHNLGLNSFKWQRSFYDHIIRNEKTLDKIRQYIRDNPKNWNMDRNNLKKGGDIYGQSKSTTKRKNFRINA
jgi:REP element-mobilizing transposase RayT